MDTFRCAIDLDPLCVPSNVARSRPRGTLTALELCEQRLSYGNGFSLQPTRSSSSKRSLCENNALCSWAYVVHSTPSTIHCRRYCSVMATDHWISSPRISIASFPSAAHSSSNFVLPIPRLFTRILPSMQCRHC